MEKRRSSCAACTAEKFGVKSRKAIPHTCGKQEQENKNRFDRVVDKINNPEPLRKPPYTCPMACYGLEHECIFPNCDCEWML